MLGLEWTKLGPSMQRFVQDLGKLDTESQLRWVNDLQKRPEDQTPEQREFIAQMAREMQVNAETPTAQLTPALQDLKRESLKMMEHIGDIEQGKVPPEMQPSISEIHDRMLEWVLKDKPVLRALQYKVDALFAGENLTQRFSLPTLLNAIAEDLKRPQHFTLIQSCITSKEELNAILVSLYRRKPTLHAQVCQVLIQAAMWEQPPHPKGCACLLCAHIASITAPSDQGSASAR